MQKEIYEGTVLEVICFKQADVILTSDEFPFQSIAESEESQPEP